MEHYTIDNGTASFIIALAILAVTLKSLIALLLIHYLAKLLKPPIARLLGFSDKLTGHSRYDVFSYLLTWLFIAPIITGVLEIFLLQTLWMGSFSEHSGVLNYSTFYLFSLTLWRYNENFEKFTLIPRIVIFMRGIVFILLTFVLHFVSSMLQTSQFGWPMSNLFMNFILHKHIIYPSAIGLITINYLKRNKLTEANHA